METKSKKSPRKHPAAKKKPAAVAHGRAGSLDAKLTGATRTAFEKFRHEHPEETLYAFVLYTTEDGDYVFSTAFTEEGFSRVVDRYRRTGKYPDEARLRRDLRFSAPDSPYHEDETAAFEGLPPGRKLHEACFAALGRLSEEGCFGKGATRILVNVVYGDMSDERWLAHAQRVNPPETVDAAMPYLRLNLPSGNVKRWGESAYQINAVSISNDRTRLAYSGSGGDVAVYDLDTRKPLFAKVTRGEHWASVISADGARLFLGDAEGIHVIDVATGVVRPFAKNAKPASMRRSADDSLLAATTQQGPMNVFDVASAKIVWSAPAIHAIAFAGDAVMTIAMRERNGLRESVVERRDAKSGAVRWSCAVEGAFHPSIACASDGSTLVASASAVRQPATIHTIDVDGRVTATVRLEGPVRALAISPDGARIVYCSGRRLVIATRSGAEITSGTGAQESLIACVFVDDKRAIAVGRDVNRGPAILELCVPD